MSETCLLLDATNRWILCGLKNDRGVHGRALHAPGEASSKLFPFIQELLSEHDCDRPDWIVAARGPGSFTGARLTVSTARNLAQLWDVPVLGVESLVFYGYACLNAAPDEERVGVLVDGKQNRVFARLAHRSRPPIEWAQEAVLDVTPDRLRELWPEGTSLYVDDERTVRRYMGDKWPTVQFNTLPEPDVANLFSLAEKLGGIAAAGPYEELTPVYARPDPAQAKYSDGYTPEV